MAKHGVGLPFKMGHSVGVPNYYWRDYSGVIPNDAIPGGYDANHRTTYIGQAYVQGEGIIPGTIHRGQKNMVVDVYGIKTCDLYLKILCGVSPKNFRWVRSTSDNFHADMINKYPVRGGVERTYLLYLGRVAIQGEVIVGKIVTGARPKPPLFVVSSGSSKAIEMQSYEALVYVP